MKLPATAGISQYRPCSGGLPSATVWAASRRICRAAAPELLPWFLVAPDGSVKTGSPDPALLLGAGGGLFGISVMVTTAAVAAAQAPSTSAPVRRRIRRDRKSTR